MTLAGVSLPNSPSETRQNRSSPRGTLGYGKGTDLMQLHSQDEGSAALRVSTDKWSCSSSAATGTRWVANHTPLRRWLLI